MRAISDLPYYSGPGFDPRYHTLDLYLPEAPSPCPAILFLHGGGWRSGTKAAEGRTGFIQLCVAEGIAVASANYRLSPKAKHPAHIQDVSRAFAWMIHNAAAYGLDRESIFVAGHSAGGHLACLLATDATYLQRERLTPRNIRGVISISGIYDLREFPEAAATSSRPDEAFGTEAATLCDASPAMKLNATADDLPPFLLAYASQDLFGFAEQAKGFYSLLLNAGRVVQLVQIPGRTHSNVVAEVGQEVPIHDFNGMPIVVAGDLLGPALIRFLRKVLDGSLPRAFRSVWPTGGPAEVARQAPPPLRVIRNLDYSQKSGSDPQLNALDLYLPYDGTNFPILFEVHGGRWRVGDKGGIPSGLVHLFVRHGWAVVSTNYRLSPAARHPAHIQDVARALGWTCRNASQYGLNPQRIVLYGSSVGGQLVSLLALDRRYLEREAVSSEAIRGVISTSGIYDIPAWLEPGKVPTGKEQAFTDVGAQREASPLRHVHAGSPPFLVTFTDHDLHLIPEQSHTFYRALRKQGVPARLMQIHDRTHFDYSSGAGQPPINLVDDILGVELISFVEELT